MITDQDKQLKNMQHTNLLLQAKFEIESLRRKNELMSARLQVFDSMMQIFHTEPYSQNQEMSPDLVFQIDKFIKMETELSPTKGNPALH